MSKAKQPHLTPRNLVGRRFPPAAFGDVKAALVGYCPPPQALGRYRSERVEGQRFIHVSPDSVRILTHGGMRILSLVHVYGGPVSATTVEELAYYGVETILAYGLAGGLGAKDLKMGDFYLVGDALAADGATPHYSRERVISADPWLCGEALSLWASASGAAPITVVRAATGDALYREDDVMLEAFRNEGCDIVNLDSAHLYAVARANAEGRTIRAIQCGVISDVVAPGPGGSSESTLAAMLDTGDSGLNPLERVGDIVAFYVERLAGRAPS
jgi:uridine phosphorylase